jgi:hypothetical protein
MSCFFFNLIKVHKRLYMKKMWRPVAVAGFSPLNAAVKLPAAGVQCC